MPRLTVIIASTRPGRGGTPVAEWFVAAARDHGAFDVDVADLAEIGLPMMDEPAHPRLQQYEHQHTRDWSARIAASDAFAVVMPEYNYGFNAPIKNALDYLHNEWQYKPMGFVSYGGVSGGTRAVQMLKQVVTTLKITPLNEAVSLPFYTQFVDDDGILRPNDVMTNAARAVLDELVRYEQALRPLRTVEA